MKINKTQKAFTLVELIVVITILAILGTIAFISLQGYSKSSRDSVRISDVSNMKTSLELFHLNAGKYPLPDDDQEVTFSGNTLWYQGEFGSTVISQLSRNINEIPTDPLTEKKYIYSVANNKNEFEILALLESDLVLNSINQTNAAIITVTPRIDGNYNGVFVKTQHHIVPVPSIINAEVGETELVLTSENIKSQVVSNLGNIPNHGNVNYSTRELDGLVLSVYTGSLDKNSNDTEKELAMIAIQDAYTNSELASDIKYANILSKIETEDLVVLFNTIVLEDSTIVVTTSGFTCGDAISALGETYTTSLITGDGGYEKCWTTQNMNHGNILADGSTMPSNIDIIEKWCYDNSSANCNAEGGLYTWSEAMGFSNNCNSNNTLPECTGIENATKSVCGQLGIGWSLPTDLQWTALTNAGATGWNGGNKLFGITSSLPGNRLISNNFDARTEGSRWWSSLERSSTRSWPRTLFSTTDIVYRIDNDKATGYSVLCIKN